MTRRAIRIFGGFLVMAFGVLALANCREDLSPTKALWQAAEAEYLAKIATFKANHRDLLKKLEHTAMPAGADAALTRLHTSAVEAAKAEGQSLTNLETALRQTREAVASALTTGKLANVQTAIENAKNDLGPAFSQMSAIVANNLKAIDGYETKVKALIAHAHAGAEPFETQAETLKTQGGMIDFTDIDFKVNSDKIDLSKKSSVETLDKLVNFAKSCKEMELAITGHTSKEGNPQTNLVLSKKRAESIKLYLEKHQAIAKIVKTDGKGSLQNAVPEPDPSSDEAKQLPEPALEALRRKNRRITVEVIKPCGR